MKSPSEQAIDEVENLLALAKADKKDKRAWRKLREALESCAGIIETQGAIERLREFVAKAEAGELDMGGICEVAAVASQWMNRKG